ncbi:MAG: hypothetical protein WA705_26160, partial [Candidatus Ozemobacteraceae bacterium]
SQASNLFSQLYFCMTVSFKYRFRQSAEKMTLAVTMRNAGKFFGNPSNKGLLSIRNPQSDWLPNDLYPVMDPVKQ